MEVRGPAGGVGVLGERAAVKRAEGGRCAGAGTALRRRRDSATPPTGEQQVRPPEYPSRCGQRRSHASRSSCRNALVRASPDSPGALRRDSRALCRDLLSLSPTGMTRGGRPGRARRSKRSSQASEVVEPAVSATRVPSSPDSLASRLACGWKKTGECVGPNEGTNPSR